MHAIDGAAAVELLTFDFLRRESRSCNGQMMCSALTADTHSTLSGMRVLAGTALTFRLWACCSAGFYFYTTQGLQLA